MKSKEPRFTLRSDSIIGYFWECSNEDCRFRYPDTSTRFGYGFCPKCGEPAIQSSKVLSMGNSSERKHDSTADLTVLLDNLRSVYNVGSIFRTCEGFGIGNILLCGITPIPEHPRMKKTSLGAENCISWTYSNNSIDAVKKLRTQNYFIVGLENTFSSVSIQEIDKNIINKPLCLVLGNEKLGIDPDIQRLCDLLVYIPMTGVKESFNVSVALGIAAYQFLEILRLH